MSFLLKPLLLLSSLALAAATRAEPPVAPRIIELRASNSGLDEITVDLQKLWCVSAEVMAARLHPDRPVKTWAVPPHTNNATTRIVIMVGELELKECLGLARFTKTTDAAVSFMVPLTASVGNPPKQTADFGDLAARLKR